MIAKRRNKYLKNDYFAQISTDRDEKYLRSSASSNLRSSVHNRFFQSSKKGFTLAELLLAAAILLFGISASLAAFVNCLLLNETNNNRVSAANDAQYVLEQIKGTDYDDIDSYAAPAFTNLRNETVSVSGLTTEIESGLKQIAVTISWTERGKNRSFTLSTHIAR